LNPVLVAGWLNPVLVAGWLNPVLVAGWLNPVLVPGWLKLFELEFVLAPNVNPLFAENIHNFFIN
jgi:hypothetical protein